MRNRSDRIIPKQVIAIAEIRTLEKRCLGRLEDPWWGWCSGQIPSCLTSPDGFSKALDIALQARLIQSGSFMSRLKWLKNQQTPLDLTILIYGALANGSPL